MSSLVSAVDFYLETVPPSVESTYVDNYTDYSDLPNSFFNKFGSEYDNERQLYDILLTEMYNKHGVRGVYFITSFDTEYDGIFGEDLDRNFKRCFDVMCYFELPKELEMWTQFGIEGLDNFKMYISKRHFVTASRVGGNSSYIPKVGDYIKSYYNDRYYEIIDVGEEDEMFLQKKHVWTLTVQKFKDTHIRLIEGTSATMGSLSAITNQIDDLFDISDVVTSAVSAIEYTSAASEGRPSSIWGDW